MTRNGLTLLETLVSLALLAVLGTVLLRIQAAAVRQLHHAHRQADIATAVERLLFAWSAGGEPVTLPASGQLDARHAWRRDVQPARIGSGLICTHVRLTITTSEAP